MVDYIVQCGEGVPLHLEAMVAAFVESSLLFMNEHGQYELGAQTPQLLLGPMLCLGYLLTEQVHTKGYEAC